MNSESSSLSRQPQLKFRFESIASYTELEQVLYPPKDKGEEASSSSPQKSSSASPSSSVSSSGASPPPAPPTIPPTLVFFDVDDTILCSKPGEGPRKRLVEEGEGEAREAAAAAGEGRSSSSVAAFAAALACLQAKYGLECVMLTQGSVEDLFAMASTTTSQQHHPKEVFQKHLTQITELFRRRGRFSEEMEKSVRAVCSSLSAGVIIPIRQVLTSPPQPTAAEGEGGEEKEKPTIASVVGVLHRKIPTTGEQENTDNNNKNTRDHSGQEDGDAFALAGISLTGVGSAVRPGNNSVFVNYKALTKMDVAVSYAEALTGAAAAALAATSEPTASIAGEAQKLEQKTQRSQQQQENQQVGVQAVVVGRIALVDNNLMELGAIQPPLPMDRAGSVAAYFAAPLNGQNADGNDDERFLGPLAQLLVQWSNEGRDASESSSAEADSAIQYVVEVVLIHYRRPSIANTSAITHQHHKIFPGETGCGDETYAQILRNIRRFHFDSPRQHPQVDDEKKASEPAGPNAQLVNRFPAFVLSSAQKAFLVSPYRLFRREVLHGLQQRFLREDLPRMQAEWHSALVPTVRNEKELAAAAGEEEKEVQRRTRLRKCAATLLNQVQYHHRLTPTGACSCALAQTTTTMAITMTNSPQREHSSCSLELLLFQLVHETPGGQAFPPHLLDDLTEAIKNAAAATATTAETKTTAEKKSVFPLHKTQTAAAKNACSDSLERFFTERLAQAVNELCGCSNEPQRQVLDADGGRVEVEVELGEVWRLLLREVQTERKRHFRQ